MTTQEQISKAAASGYEVIICAAVRFKGKIWRGHRHGDAMEVMHGEMSYTMTRKEMHKAQMDNDQGFITSNNRYVDRDEALEIQRSANIKSHCPDGYRGQLYSEDLY